MREISFGIICLLKNVNLAPVRALGVATYQVARDGSGAKPNTGPCMIRLSWRSHRAWLHGIYDSEILSHPENK